MLAGCEMQPLRGGLSEVFKSWGVSTLVCGWLSFLNLYKGDSNTYRPGRKPCCPRD